PPGHRPPPARRENRDGTTSDPCFGPRPTPVGCASHLWLRLPAWPVPTPAGYVLARRVAQNLAPSPRPSPRRRVPAWPPRLGSTGRRWQHRVPHTPGWGGGPPAGPGPVPPDAAAVPGPHSPTPTGPARAR